MAAMMHSLVLFNSQSSLNLTDMSVAYILQKKHSKIILHHWDMHI